jgi:hypothetical protein
VGLERGGRGSGGVFSIEILTLSPPVGHLPTPYSVVPRLPWKSLDFPLPSNVFLLQGES